MRGQRVAGGSREERQRAYGDEKRKREDEGREEKGSVWRIRL